MYETLVQPIENITANLFDRAANVICGKPSDLRELTENKSINLPHDLYAHPNVQTEWWYYTGHCETVSGRRFGFELVFFKRRTDFDRLGIFPIRLLANPVYAAHFAVTDFEKKQFHYEHHRSFNRSFDLPAAACEDRYYLRLGNWTISEAAGSHILRAMVKNEFVFEATLKNTKPAVLNGIEGISFKDVSEASCHFSFTRMNVEGQISNSGVVENFTGTAWMDREFGTWYQNDWDWFSIQLDDGSELMIYQFRNQRGETSRFSHGTFINLRGQDTNLNLNDFSVEPTNFWQSPKTKTIYPSGWRLCVPPLNIELEIAPVIKNQELDTRGTTMIVYWEGACEVSGSIAGTTLKGRAYAELVGYDRSRENPSLSKFLLSLSIKKDWQRIFL